MVTNGISFVNLHNKSPRKVNFLNLLFISKTMKKVILIAGISALVSGACSSLKKSTYNDDVYVDPKIEKLEKERLAAAKKKQEEEAEKKRQEELAAQKAKDDANPAYKDPVYDKDDYYDYQYASRLRRFNNPVYGIGYYDNYYTNYYWYNGNPAYYGTSIYSSYNWWGPSYSCGPNFGFGMSYNYGYPNYGYYDPYYYGSYGYGYSPYGYGYNPYGYGYNPYYFGYNPYWQGYYNGYHNGYYNGYNNGWGYYNSFDANSGYGKTTYAPRTSHDGGNGGRVSNPGLNQSEDSYKVKYLQAIANEQSNTPKFTESIKPVKTGKSIDHYSGTIPAGSPTIYQGEPRTNIYGNNPVNNNPKNNTWNNEGNEIQMNNNPNPIKINPGRNNNSENAPKQNPINIDKPKGNIFESGSQPQFNGGNNNPSPSGGSPRGGNSSGSSNRPR